MQSEQKAENWLIKVQKIKTFQSLTYPKAWQIINKFSSLAHRSSIFNSATVDCSWPFIGSSQTMCFEFKQSEYTFSPFLCHSPPLSHMHTSGSREVKAAFLNQLFLHLFNWKNKLSHVSSGSPEFYNSGIFDAKWSSDMHDYWWTLYLAPLSQTVVWKFFQKGGCFQRHGYLPSDLTLAKNRTSNKYAKLR